MSKILRDLERYQEVSRHAQALAGPLEQVRRQQEMISSVLPYYDATRKLMEISEASRDVAGIAVRAQEIMDSLSPGVPRLQRAMLELLVDQARIDRAVRSSFLPSFELTDALTRASASIRQMGSIHSPHVPIAFAPMQETVARTLGMRSLIEEHMDLANLRPEIQGVWEGLGELTAGSTILWNRFADDPQELVRVPEFLREVPVLQLFEATRSTGLLLIDEPELIDAEPAPGLLVAEAGELEDRLAAINPDLVERYRGAIEALGRRGSDYVRQVAVSLRELFVHLFLTIAPRTAIEAWDSQVLPKAGKVPYRAHLEYIYRGQAALAGYATITEKDIDHVLQNFYVLDEGVHKLKPDFEYEQMRALVRRCEYCLLSILHAYEITAATQ
jgi:hypothetical protein